MNTPLLALLLGVTVSTAAVAAPPASSTAALEALLACKAGSDFTEAQVDQAFHAAGLSRDPGSVFEPKDKPVALFGGTVASADVSISNPYKSLHVYLKGVDHQRLARSWGVTTVNEEAETEAPSYLKKVDARHTLHVGAADDYEGYSASVTCQIHS
ncbi:hypothetical protein CR156_06355 [Stenotrophomonas lactitubi]|uniref:hypothetical protein n=1 Tax=Stenotrophomonas lactitubi TaxID=2045214 RepID=UPI000C27EA96|nr:hypothetical protein [Stenotrophomonas lactitubi]PJO51843.1 hypothetical protein CR156_06355 [Stenotrophomonas lactitubi]